MKLAPNKNITIVEADSPVNSFKMLVNSKSFGIIVGGIYSDKILALVREYTCNGIDSHKEDGHEKPYDVHMPDYSHPTFFVRDYGVGLDEDDIVTVFTVAFASTKENSNLATGMLGIGGMVGFCYNTKSFTVTSWKNGKKYIYHCFIGDEGVPSYTKLLEEDSDEPTGVKVELPVHANDFSYFRNAGERLFPWYDIKPNIVNGTVNIKPANCHYEKESWGVYSGIEGAYVLMGNILYPIEVGEPSLSKYKQVINSNVVIKAEIGAVDFTPSREQLQYTPRTVSFLRKQLSLVIEELVKEVENSIVGAPSYWAAKMSKLKVYNSLNSELKGIIHPHLKDVKYKGEPLNKDVVMPKTEYNYRYFSYYPHLKTGCKEQGIAVIDSNATVNIYRADPKKENSRISKVKLDIKTKGVAGILIEGTIEQIKATFNCVESDIIEVANLPKPVVVRYNRGKLGALSQWTHDSRSTYSWIPPVNFKDGDNYYVVRTGYKIVFHDGSHKDPNQFYRSYELIKDAEGKDVPVYSVTQKNIKDVPDNWIEATSYATELIESDRANCQEYLNAYRYNHHIKMEMDSNDSLIKFIKKVDHKLGESHPLIKWKNNLYDLLEKSKDELKSKKRPQSFDIKCQVLGINPTYSEPDFMDRLIRKYSLLKRYMKQVSSYYNSFKMDDSELLDYIKGVDK